MPRAGIIYRLTFAILLSALCAQAGGAIETNFAARAETVFQSARQAFQTNRENPTNAWHFARACFDLAELATNKTQRAETARLGIAAAKTALAHEPRSVAGHYYLAMNYGQLAAAEAPSLAAYRLVWEIEREFKTTTEIDERFDFAGPVRCLGLLYRDAPGWPLSVGNRRKAKEFLERAVQLAPEFPENHLNLAEAHLRWKNLPEAATALKQAELHWPAARTNLTGITWEKSWHDWTLQKNAAQTEYLRLTRNLR